MMEDRLIELLAKTLTSLKETEDALTFSKCRVLELEIELLEQNQVLRKMDYDHLILEDE